MIVIDSIKNDVYCFGRDTSGNVYKEKHSARSYFYVEDTEGKYKTVYGKLASKKFIDSDLSKYASSMKYESDVNEVHRYLVDNVEKIEKELMRICYLDIETEMLYDIDVVKTPNKILSITCFDNFLRKYVTFIVSEGKTNYRSEEKSCYFFKDEKSMLLKFTCFIESTDPDMIVAWNGSEFDFPYLINRMTTIGLNIRKLSRLGVSYYDNGRTVVKGRILFDLLKAYRKIFQSGRESYSLEYISMYEFNEGKEKYDCSLGELYFKDLDRFISYNVRDVELMKMIDEKIRIIEFFDEIRRLALCTFYDVFDNSRIIDQIMLKKARHNNVVLPDKKLSNKKDFKGAFVMIPNPGIYENVAVFDMKSLYPSIMVSFNLGFDTILDNKTKDCVDIDGKFFFRQDKESMVKKILYDFIYERKCLREKMKSYDKKSDEYKSFDSRQYALKQITNSFYGYVAYPNSRLFNIKVAEVITYLGRKIIHNVIDFLTSRKINVVYSDTDSVFICLNEVDMNNIKALVSQVNENIDLFMCSFNIKKHIIEIQEDNKRFKKIMFTGVRKRYAGITFNAKNEDDIIIVGFEYKRSDCPQIGRDFQKKLFWMLLNNENKKNIKAFIEQTKKNVLLSKIEDIGIPVTLNKEILEYKNNPIHVRAVNNANKYHNAKIKCGDKVKYVFIRYGGKCNDDVIAFKDKMWEGYVVNYERMVERIIDNKLKNISNVYSDFENKKITEWIK